MSKELFNDLLINDGEQIAGEFHMTRHSVGDTPLRLADDGSFDTSFGVRTQAILDEDGQILVVDKKTKRLVLNPEEA